MKVIFQDQNKALLRFDRGEEVISGLVDFASSQALPAATFTGLGACDELELSYYDMERKVYVRQKFSEDLEILGLTGNIAWLSDQPVIHAHGSFSRKDFSAIGGHIFVLRVSGTCEIHINKISEKLTRAKDEETGLNLLD